jgi:hypothetical protein
MQNLILNNFVVDSFFDFWRSLAISGHFFKKNSLGLGLGLGLDAIYEYRLPENWPKIEIFRFFGGFSDFSSFCH